MNGENFTQPGTPEYEFVRYTKQMILAKLDLYEIAIIHELMQPSPDYEGLIKTLRTQRDENPDVMYNILGRHGSGLLEKILP